MLGRERPLRGLGGISREEREKSKHDPCVEMFPLNTDAVEHEASLKSSFPDEVLSVEPRFPSVRCQQNVLEERVLGFKRSSH